MQKEVIFSEAKGRLTAHIQKDVDHHLAKAMREAIDKKLFESRPSLLILDFSQVGFMDSSGIGLIIGRVEKASVLNIQVAISGLSSTLMKLVRLSGIERLRNLSIVK